MQTWKLHCADCPEVPSSPGKPGTCEKHLPLLWSGKYLSLLQQHETIWPASCVTDVLDCLGSSHLHIKYPYFPMGVSVNKQHEVLSKLISNTVYFPVVLSQWWSFPRYSGKVCYKGLGFFSHIDLPQDSLIPGVLTAVKTVKLLKRQLIENHWNYSWHLQKRKRLHDLSFLQQAIW